METIVVGYDGSGGAEVALSRAAELAEALGARLVVVSVVTPAREPPGAIAEPLPLGAGPGALLPLPVVETAEPAPAVEDLAQRRLEQARSALRSRHVDAEYVAETGGTAERLLEVADERDADLIVVGSREHGFVERLLARPVEETVARRAARDVLLVSTEGRR